MPQVATDRFPTDTESMAAFQAAHKIFHDVIRPWASDGVHYEAMEHDGAFCARRSCIEALDAPERLAAIGGVPLVEERVDLVITVPADLILTHLKGDAIAALRLDPQAGDSELCRIADEWLAERSECLSFDDEDDEEAQPSS